MSTIITSQDQKLDSLVGDLFLTVIPETPDDRQCLYILVLVNCHFVLFVSCPVGLLTSTSLYL